MIQPPSVGAIFSFYGKYSIISAALNTLKLNNMKTIKIDFNGDISHEKQFNNILKFNGLKASKDIIEALDSEIEFYVCDLRAAHGNLNKYDKSAWLSPVNNDGSFNIRINW